MVPRRAAFPRSAHREGATTATATHHRAAFNSGADPPSHRPWPPARRGCARGAKMDDLFDAFDDTATAALLPVVVAPPKPAGAAAATAAAAAEASPAGAWPCALSPPPASPWDEPLLPPFSPPSHVFGTLGSGGAAGIQAEDAERAQGAPSASRRKQPVLIWHKGRGKAVQWRGERGVRPRLLRRTAGAPAQSFRRGPSRSIRLRGPAGADDPLSGQEPPVSQAGSSVHRRDD